MSPFFFKEEHKESKMSELNQTVITKIHNSGVVSSSMTTNIRQSAERLASRFLELPESQRLTTEEIKKIMLAELALLESQTNRLRGLAALHATEKSEDLEVREHVNVAYHSLHEVLSATRERIVELGGDTLRRTYGIPRTLPRRRNQLKTVCEEILKRFAENPKTFQDRFAGEITSAQLSSPLGKATQEFADTYDALQLEQRETEDAMFKRDQEEEQWEQTYRAVSYRMMGAFDLAGMSEHAERLRPTIRRQKGEEKIEAPQIELSSSNESNEIEGFEEKGLATVQK